MARKTRRDYVRPIIAEVIERVGTEDTKRLRAALREAYPFGVKKYHPYRIWCHEILVQLGKRQPLYGGRRQNDEVCAGQRSLFEELN